MKLKTVCIKISPKIKIPEKPNFFGLVGIYLGFLKT